MHLVIYALHLVIYALHLRPENTLHTFIIIKASSYALHLRPEIARKLCMFSQVSTNRPRRDIKQLRSPLELSNTQLHSSSRNPSNPPSLLSSLTSIDLKMHFSTLLAVLAPVIATVQATCYGSGDTWAPDQVQANAVLDDVCNSLSGDYSTGQTKYACRNANSPNKKFDFYIKKVQNGGGAISHADCVYRLSNEINGCSSGGVSTVNVHEFR
jgi:hypothetical protein